MGYRHYFYKVSKSEVEKVKNMDYEQLFEYAKKCKADCDEEEKNFYFNDDVFMNKKEVFEFGKLYWDDTADRIYKTGVPLFIKDNVQEQFSDYDPYVVGKEGLLEAIKIYTEKVIAYYKDLLVDGKDYKLPLGITVHKEDIKSVDKIAEHIENKLRSISIRGLVNTYDDCNYLTDSWEYEHSIFNLAFLLKTIDFEKETLLFYGW